MSIRKNMISNLLLTSSSVIFPLITFPYVTRTLSSSSIGKYFFMDALTQYIILFTAVGVPYYGVREVAKVKNDAAKRSKLVAELLCIQIILAVLFSLVLICLHGQISLIKNDPALVKIACIAIISSAFLMDWFYQGTENFTYITGRSLIIKTLSVISILLLVKHPDDYLIYYLLTVMLILFNAALNFTNYLKNHHTVYPDKLDVGTHLKPLFILFSVNVSISVYAILDTIILGLFTDPATVSYYSVPLKLVKMYWMVVNGAGMVLIPRVASYYVERDFTAIQNVMKKSMSIVFLLTIPFCFFCTMFPDEILTLISGAKYLPAANVLRVLSGVPFIISVCNVCGTQFLMPIGREKSILYATIIGLIISLALNFLLIPHLRAMGTAIACVAAEGAVCSYIFIAAVKHTELKIDHPLLSQILIGLFATLLLRPFLALYLNGLVLVVAAVAFYCSAFVFLQFVYFKNEFIFSIVGYNRSRSKIL